MKAIAELLGLGAEIKAVGRSASLEMLTLKLGNRDDPIQ